MFFASQPRWRTIQRVLVLCLLAPLCAACADLESAPETPPTAVVSSRPAPAAPSNFTPADTPGQQTWLVMLYEDADDEVLEQDMMNDLNEAELIGSTDRVKVVAQMDRYDGGYDGDDDWTTAKRFLLQQDDDLEQLHSKELADLGEVNMADASTLVDFVSWAAESYPADKYVLIMSDHGAGWPGGWSDSDPGDGPSTDAPLAESFGDMLFLSEINGALGTIMAQTNIGQFEMIGFDACLMSSLEVYSAVAPYARYAVASQEVEPTLGWAYAAFLERLAKHPEIDGKQLASTIVDSYIDQDEQIVNNAARAKYVERMYDSKERTSAKELAEEEGQQSTLTSLDLAALPAVNSAVDGLARALTTAKARQVSSARRYAQSFETVFDEDQPAPYIDLGSFAQLLKEKVDAPAVHTAADAVLAAIDQAVLKEKHGESNAGATGISIYFPNSTLYKDADAGAKSYTSVADTFAKQSLWDDYLAFYYTKRPLPASSAQAPPTAVPEQVSAPDVAPITVAPVTVSSQQVTASKPVALHSTVSGDQIGFIYMFIGVQDPKTKDIQLMDMDFLDADETKEVGGVYYPDWGSGANIPIDFTWEGRLYAIAGGSSQQRALFRPKDYGASADQATYTVEGTFTTARGKVARRAQMIFSSGELIKVLASTSTAPSGSLREVTPKSGDRFTISEQWLDHGTRQGEKATFITKPGKTIVFGKNPITWNDVAAPKGNYLVGFIAEDLDGNWYESHTQVAMK